jgi:hypothetical protein
MPPAGSDPGLVMAAGDWHGNLNWASGRVFSAWKKLEGEPRKIIVHCGDFGFYDDRGGRYYLDTLNAVCERHDIEIWAVDGNHEDHGYLAEKLRDCPPRQKAWIRHRIAWLPRGYRWQWHGRTWLALGGAVSVDKALREEGVSWWPQEEITREQADAVIAAGHADVVIAHDAPSSVPMTFPEKPAAWDWADIRRSEAHRELAEEIRQGITPSWWLNGHYHHSAVRHVRDAHGEMLAVQLDCDGSSYRSRSVNSIILDTRTMDFT